MSAIGAAMISTAGNLLGGLFGKKSANSQSMKDRALALEMMRKQRDIELDLRQDERKYLEGITARDRAYAASLLDDERAYSRERQEYQLDVDRKALLDARQYMEGQKLDDRSYLDQKRDQDIAQYSKDRDLMQGRSDMYAEKSAASRGIDFQRLRDDAVKAGYNPLTALSMAHAYSTNIDYQVQGGVYSPGASYVSNGGSYVAPGGGGGAGGGGPALPSSPMVASHVPAGGGVGISGAGYQSNHQPSISSASFVADAFDRVADLWSNRPGRDPLADALRNAMQGTEMADQVRSADYSRSFGYDLTKQEPFRPSATVGVPPLRSDQDQTLQPRSKPSPSDDLVSPSRQAIKVHGADFEPLSGSSDAAAIEERYGDIPSGFYGFGNLLYDLGANARIAYEKARGRKVEKIGGRYYLQESGPKISPKSKDYFKSGTTGQMLLDSYSGQLGAW